MKTDVITVDNKGDSLQLALNRIEGLANSVTKSDKNGHYLRLMAEELFGIVSANAGDFTAKFWAENQNRDFRIVLEADAKELPDEAKKDLLSISSTGENSEDSGIMDKIGSLFCFFAKGGNAANVKTFDCGYSETSGDISWSLKDYKSTIKNKNLDASLEELSKSVIANIVDDIKVGVKDKKVKIEIFKTF